MSLKSRITVGALVLSLGLVSTFEGLIFKTYIDPVGIPTVCYGHTGRDVVIGEVKTETECEDLLAQDIILASEAVDRLVLVPLKDHQHAAFTSFVYNVGAGNFASSTMLKLINKGEIDKACHELPRWKYAKGKELPGLVKRRAAEMKVCLGQLNSTLLLQWWQRFSDLAHMLTQ